ncbi:MAG TPA: alpha-L-fucosidase, partial [Planctomycetota bacterium]|nr:alpha-L-fucosidase [Planctomycetota bacterium]
MKQHLLAAFGLLLASSSCRESGTARRPDDDPTATRIVELDDAEVQRVVADAGRDKRMDWWRDARFGMFIHWGLYAIPAGKWEGSTDHAEWIMNTAHIPVEQYEPFQAQFNPVKFAPDEWARMAQDAGMKYVVITSKHHDGFALFDSKTSDYDVMATPFQRDILRELGEAVRGRGMQMCFYHSIMDWHHPDYVPRREWEKRSAEGADFARYRKYLHDEVTELLTNYGKIGVMWFDGEWESTWTNEYGKELYALCRKLQPDVIVNNRVSTGRAGMQGMTKGSEFPGDFGTPEQEIPAQGLPGVDWETCMTMNDHWGFNAADDHWKSTEDLVRKLCDIASKGGNFLLNVGPRADGIFPPEAVQRLAEIGRWMRVNGEAIHGTQASPMETPSWGRCTMRRNSKGTTLYLHVFDWPVGGVLKLDGLGNEILGARLL